MQIPPPTETTAWHHQSAEDVLAGLDTTTTGLTTAEAARRLAAGGRNVLAEVAPVSPWRIFSRQFKSLVIWILVVAGIVSGVLGDAVDAIAIFVVVALNAIIGFYQELNARKSISALKTMTAPRAKVKRDGKVVSIPAAEIVTGDVLVMEAGDSVAADSRLLKSASLKCVESALTGEAEAVLKHAATLKPGDVALGDRKNMVFMGTSVAAGTGRAVVVGTAMRTELGRIAGLMEDSKVDESTPLEKKLESFGRVLVWGALGIVALLFGLGLLRGTAPLELFMTAVGLAVAAVPEGLPAIVTVALALGVSRMSRRRALVRRLAAVETLGSTTVICTDKTGTLTMGEMTVRALYIPDRVYEVTGEGYGPDGELLCDGERIDTAPLRELATVIVGCNNAHLVEEKGAWKAIGDPTEGALLAAGRKAGVVREELERTMPKHHEIPFDSDRKRSTVVRTMPDGKLRALVNGAPGILLDCCSRISTPDGIRPITSGDREQVLARTDTMAAQALRVLGSAFRDLETSAELTAEAVERDLVFVGLSGMYDPPRQEAKNAVAECRAAGIRVVLITGDHPYTATAIAREIGITTGGEAAVSGIELDKMGEDELRRRAPEIAVYARVTAAHKLRIIHAWKANDAVVAMTGDGVNDAPAIQGADIGIAMGKTGTEVTKQAADMIITDDNFSTIVAAVEEGRGIYDNIRKTLQYLLAGSTAELLVMAACVIIGLPSPLVAHPPVMDQPDHRRSARAVPRHRSHRRRGDETPAAASAGKHRRPAVSHDDAFHRLHHRGHHLRGLSLRVEDAESGDGPFLCLRGARLRGVVESLRRAQRIHARLADPAPHQPQSGDRHRRFLRPTNPEPGERGVRKIFKHAFHSADPLPAAHAHRHGPADDSGSGESDEAGEKLDQGATKPRGR